MKTIIASLESVANNLQDAGLVRLATLVDNVLNTIDFDNPQDLGSGYSDKLDLFKQMILNLEESALGHIEQFKYLVPKLKARIVGTPTPGQVASIPEWQKFQDFVTTYKGKDGTKVNYVIPDVFFKSGKNSKGYKLADLADMILVLKMANEGTAEHADLVEKRNIFKEEKRRDDLHHSKRWQEADSLFRNPADMAKSAFIDTSKIIDPKITNVLGLLEALKKRSETTIGNYAGTRY